MSRQQSAAKPAGYVRHNNDSNQPEHGLWTSVAFGDYLHTGIHINGDGIPGTIVLDAANCRKLIAMLVADVMMLENVLEIAGGAR